VGCGNRRCIQLVLPKSLYYKILRQHWGKDKEVKVHTERGLIILEIVEEAKDADEEIDEVKIKRNGAHDVLIWG